MPAGDRSDGPIDREELFSPYELLLAELETDELETVHASSAIVQRHCERLLDERAEDLDEGLQYCLEQVADRVENRRALVESELAYRGE